MAHLVTHVYGEHLGQWDDGIKMLQMMKHLPSLENGSESDKEINRSMDWQQSCATFFAALEI